MHVNSERISANWISALLCVLSIAVFFITPFYSVLNVEINGFLFLRFHLAAILLPILGIVAALGAYILPPIVGIILESAYAFAILLFMALGNHFAASFISSGLQHISPEWASYANPVVSLIVARIGWGSLVCLFLAIAAVVVDIILNLSRRQRVSSEFVLGKDDDFF